VTTYIFGVDPGESTGVAWLNLDTRVLIAFQGTPTDALTFLEIGLSRVTVGDVCHVGCERFVSMRGRAQSHQPTAQRVAGAVEALAYRYAVGCVLQSPADAWAVAPNELLRKLDYFQKGERFNTPDANDANMAVRHALLVTARTYASRFEALVRDVGWFNT